MSVRYTIECMGFKHGGEVAGEHVYMGAESGPHTAEHFKSMCERAGARAEVMPTKTVGRFVVVAYVKVGEP